MLELSRARDLAESRRGEVAAALAEEMETSSGLRAEMAHLHSTHQDILDKLNARTTALTRWVVCTGLKFNTLYSIIHQYNIVLLPTLACL